MKTETFHPFEVFISKGIWEGSEAEILVNSGTVYNFYNPLNFRKVKINSGSEYLPDLPLSPAISTNSSKINPKTVSVPLSATATRVAIYLLASFLPPKKWVPSAYYIPKVDESWVMFRIYQDKEEQNSFYIVGNSKNSKEDHIKYETFDVNSFAAPTEGEHSETSLFYEVNPFFQGNAFNLGIIATMEKDGAGNWSINQCIKENFPVSFFLNTEHYQYFNTEKFYIGERETLTDEEILEKESKRIDIFSVCRDYTSVHEYRGSIQSHNINGYAVPQSVQLKFPLPYSNLKESLDIYTEIEDL